MAEGDHVRGYHGTNIEAATSILTEGFKLSRNQYDWLGDGVYFFQDAPARAWDWADEHYGVDAAVIESLVRLEDCMDLLDIAWGSVLNEAYNAFLAQLKRANLPIPKQTSGAHRLDREVINYSVGVLAERGINIRVVRGVFSEGKPVFRNSALFSLSHIQIAVRDTSLIVESHLLQRTGG